MMDDRKRTRKRQPSKDKQPPENKQSMENRKPAEKQRPAETSVLQDLGSLLLKIIIVAVCIAILFTFIYGIYRSGEISMKPAIKDGDIVIYYRLDKNYVSSDIAVFKYDGQLMAGRVVAVAGDTVDITEDGLLINGAYQQETELDLIGETNRFADGIDFPLTVAEGEVFVLGDNREGATDSRMFGPAKIADCKGKVITIIRRRNL